MPKLQAAIATYEPTVAVWQDPIGAGPIPSTFGLRLPACRWRGNEHAVPMADAIALLCCRRWIARRQNSSQASKRVHNRKWNWILVWLPAIGDIASLGIGHSP